MTKLIRVDATNQSSTLFVRICYLESLLTHTKENNHTEKKNLDLMRKWTSNKLRIPKSGSDDVQHYDVADQVVKCTSM